MVRKKGKYEDKLISHMKDLDFNIDTYLSSKCAVIDIPYHSNSTIYYISVLLKDGTFIYRCPKIYLLATLEEIQENFGKNQKVINNSHKKDLSNIDYQWTTISYIRDEVTRYAGN